MYLKGFIRNLCQNKDNDGSQQSYRQIEDERSCIDSSSDFGILLRTDVFDQCILNQAKSQHLDDGGNEQKNGPNSEELSGKASDKQEEATETK